MDNSKVGLRRRFSLLRSKIKTTLAISHREEDLSVKSFSALQKNILEYLTELEIRVDKIQLLSSNKN